MSSRETAKCFSSTIEGSAKAASGSQIRSLLYSIPVKVGQQSRRHALTSWANALHLCMLDTRDLLDLGLVTRVGHRRRTGVLLDFENNILECL